jgi:hypothetical protein
MKEKIKIIDNFLNTIEFNNLKKLLLSFDFPWYLNKIDTKVKSHQLTHLFFIEKKINSNFYKDIENIISKINPLQIIRIKANLLWKNNDIKYYTYHTDYPIDNLINNLYTGIYYLNTNNGYTKFKNGKKIKSIENRMIIFPYYLKHTGSTCTDKEMRIVINFNFIKKL